MSPKEKAKNRHLIKSYGITLEEYNKKLEDQVFSCALCGKHQSNFKRSLAVDHNHKTGKVRGLICLHCNREIVRRNTYRTACGLLDYMRKYDHEESLDESTVPKK